jgi:hypothetical protein
MAVQRFAVEEYFPKDDEEDCGDLREAQQEYR